MKAVPPHTDIEDYGLIGNCRTAAMISRYGSIDWCCFPRFDSPSVFSALLDKEQGGSFSISPVEEYDSEQIYLKDTNILETTFKTKSGCVRIRDFFSVDAEDNMSLTPDHEILRLLEGVSGAVVLRMIYRPRLEYGRTEACLRYREGFGIVCAHGLHLLTLRCDLFSSRPELKNFKNQAEACLEFRLRAGEKISFSLSYNDDAPAVFPPLGGHEFIRLDQSIAIWKAWMSQFQYSGLYSDHVRRSALALKLLTFAPSGAMIAAPTTSLPEAIGGVRNWDYRYCWLRDASFAVRALVSLGFFDEAKAYVSWTLHTTHLTRPRLQVLYSVYGEPTTTEKILPWARGYENSVPVRIGNAAHRQFQLDVYGEVLDGFFALAPYLKEIDHATRKFIIEKGKVICDVWDQPDDGIWEPRAGRSHHTHSKVLAWVALDRIIRLCEKLKWKATLDCFKETASKLCQAIESRGYNSEIESYTGKFDSSELDASLLIMPLVGYCKASSPRMINTRRAIVAGLSKNNLIYRYQTDDTEDGLPGAEGSFGVCNFWLAENLALSGNLEEAKICFENILNKGNRVGLWSEEIDPETGRFLGNYPQGLSHLGLINAALTLNQVQQEQEGFKNAV